MDHQGLYVITDENVETWGSFSCMITLLLRLPVWKRVAKQRKEMGGTGESFQYV